MSSFDTAMQILGLLGRERPLLRVGEVCRDLAIPKSSVSRLLRAMEEARLLQRAEAGGYVTGPRALALANLYLERWGLLDRADAALGELVSTFGFTGFASALDGSDIVLLRVRQGSYPLRYVREIGTRLPAWSTAMGMVLLAQLSDPAALARLKAAPDLDREALLATLQTVRTRGFVTAGSALTPGATTTAAAVRDPVSGEALAIGLAFPDSAVDPGLRGRMQDLVKETAERLRCAPQPHTDTASTGAGPTRVPTG
jgi:DNA-binding IclR family transcriptional regulator